MTQTMQRPPRSAIGIFFLGSGAMALIGGFHLFLGIAALLAGDAQVVGPSVPVDLAAAIGGWIHLLVGGGVLVAVVFLISDAAWARRVGIGAAGLGALLHLPWLPQIGCNEPPLRSLLASNRFRPVRAPAPSPSNLLSSPVSRRFRIRARRSLNTPSRRMSRR